MRYWQACRDFVRELRRDFHHTGAVLPSSQFLARAMTASMQAPRKPARVLEVGPGTGAVTTEIVRWLQPEDRLDIVEINPHFVELLSRRLATEAQFARCNGQIRLINSGVENLPGDHRYDFIVSSLPLNNFRADSVRRIFRVFRQRLLPGGTLTFFEYLLVRRLKSPFVGRSERRRLLKVGRVVGAYVRRYQFGQRHIYANVPPAAVRYLRF